MFDTRFWIILGLFVGKKWRIPIYALPDNSMSSRVGSRVWRAEVISTRVGSRVWRVGVDHTRVGTRVYPSGVR